MTKISSACQLLAPSFHAMTSLIGGPFAAVSGLSFFWHFLAMGVLSLYSLHQEEKWMSLGKQMDEKI